MGLQFKTISGGKYRFIVKSDLRNRVKNAGRENIVFDDGGFRYRSIHPTLTTRITTRIVY
jgi:hypothetical protein